MKVWEFLLWFQFALVLFWFSFVFVTHLVSGAGLEPTTPRRKTATAPSGPSSALRRAEIQSEEEEEAVEEGQPSWSSGRSWVLVRRLGSALAASESSSLRWSLMQRLLVQIHLRIYHQFTIRAGFELKFCAFKSIQKLLFCVKSVIVSIWIRTF